MYTQVSSNSPCPPIRLVSTNGSSLPVRRASVFCGSNRAQRRAASKSNSATSETELHIRVDLAARFLERVREVVLKRDRGQSELYQVRIGLDTCLPFGLPDQGRTHSAADAAALFSQKTGLFSRLHDGLEPRFAGDDVTRLGIPLHNLRPPCPALRQASRRLLCRAFCGPAC